MARQWPINVRNGWEKRICQIPRMKQADLEIVKYEQMA